jgi:hypothetical protein
MRKLTPKTIFVIVGLIIIAVSAKLFSFHRISSNERADNPLSCPYYVTLESILANYPLLATDKANIQFIKQKVYQFEKDIKLSKSDITLNYKNKYQAMLNKFSINSIDNLTKNSLILTFANSIYKTIDDYYLDPRLFCINPLYIQRSDANRRIMHYNIASLYNQIPNRFMRILAANSNDDQLGVYSGFFVNNGTTTLGPQFMSGLPMVSALYVMPKYFYDNLGSYLGQVPWGYFTPPAFFDGITRKVLDISGIDVFSVSKTTVAKLKLPPFKNAIPLDTNIRPQFGSDYDVYLNTNSYGMVYLANHITYENPHNINHYEKAIKKFFANPVNHDKYDFIDITNILYQKLMLLKDKQDIILETSSTVEPLIDDNIPAGNAVIKGLVGERIWLNANCLRQNCSLVLNVAKARGWKAYVDGRAVQISRANFAFMDIPVSHGNSSIWFIYAPIPALISYFLSIISLIILFFVSTKRAYKV